MFQILFEKVNFFYEKIFTIYGKFLSKHYAMIILAAVLLNCLLSLGIFKMQLVTDKDVLFTLKNSEALRDEKLIHNLFNSSLDSDDFYMHQMTGMGTWGEVNFKTCSKSKDHKAENILQEKHLRTIKSIHEFLLANTTVNIGNRTIGFEDICVKQGQRCVVDGADLLNPRFYIHQLSEFMLKKDLIEKENSELGYQSNQHEGEFQFYMDGSRISNLDYNLGKFKKKYYSLN